MSQSAQSNNSKNNLAFTNVQAYTMAVITLVIGIAVGYFARGSAPGTAAATGPSQQAIAPSAMGDSAAMGPGQLPGSAPAQQAASPEMLAKAAEPLMAKLQSNPNDVGTIIQLGNIYYDGQSYPDAIKYYQQALKINPNNADVETDMGTSYWYTGDADQALACFQKSLKLRPNHPGTLFNEGIVLWQGKKDPKAAVAVWEKLLQTNPNYEQKDQVQTLIERAKMHGEGAMKG